MTTIALFAWTLLGSHFQASPPSGFVYTGGQGPPIARPNQVFSHEAGPVENLGKVYQAVGGGNFSMALRTDGSVVVWGGNDNGELGQGSLKAQASFSPKVVPGLPIIKAIAAGVSSCYAVTASGEAYAWGSNGAGQLGASLPKKNPTPTKIAGLSGVASVAAGYGHALALRTDGTVWTWGANNVGQLGDGTVVSRAAPTLVPGLTNVTQVAVGGNRSFALRSDGTVWAWGYNTALGRLGVGTGAPEVVKSPVAVAGVSLAKEIAAGLDHTLVLRDNGMVMSWGKNEYGQLGDPGVPMTYGGTSAAAIVPSLSSIQHLGAGSETSFAIDENGALWVFGRSDTVIEPFKVDVPTKATNVEKVLSVGGGTFHTILVSATKTPIWAACTPNFVVAPYESTTMRVMVEGGVTTQDIPIAITSLDSGAVVVGSATILTGSNYVDVPVTAPNRVMTSRIAILRVQTGNVSATTPLSLFAQTLMMRTGFEIYGGDTGAGILQLNYKAPAGGLDATIASDHSSSVSFPATIHIPEGSNNATFSIQTAPTVSTVLVNFTADVGDRHAASDFLIKGNAMASMSFDPPTVVGTNSTVLTVHLAAAAPAGGTAVHVLGIPPGFTLPDTITVPEGATVASVTTTTPAVKEAASGFTTAYVDGSYPRVARLIVLPPALSTITPLAPTVKSGQQIKFEIALEAPSAGDTVALTSSDASLTIPATFHIPAGAKKMTVTATTSTLSASKLVTVQAKLRGKAVSAKVIVAAPPPALIAITFPIDQIKAGKTMDGTVVLASAAFIDGSTIKLTSNAPDIFSVPAVVTVLPGRATAKFKATTINFVPENRKVAIIAKQEGTQQKMIVTVTP